MRVKLVFETPLPKRCCWYEISDTEQQYNSIRDLEASIMQAFELETQGPYGFNLSLDAFELLPSGTIFGLLRENDTICVKPRLIDDKIEGKIADQAQEKVVVNKVSKKSFVTPPELNKRKHQASREEGEFKRNDLQTKKRKTGSSSSSDSSTNDERTSESDTSSRTSSDPDNNKRSKNKKFKINSGGKNITTGKQKSLINSKKIKKNKTKKESSSEDSDSSSDSSSTSCKSERDTVTNDDIQAKRILRASTTNESNATRLKITPQNMAEPELKNVDNVDQMHLKMELGGNVLNEAQESSSVMNSPSVQSKFSANGDPSEYTKEYYGNLEIKPPLSLSSTSNKKKGYLQGMLALTPNHVRFANEEKGNNKTLPNGKFSEERPKETDNISLAFQSPQDVPPGRAIVTRVDIQQAAKKRKTRKKKKGQHNAQQNLIHEQGYSEKIVESHGVISEEIKKFDQGDIIDYTQLELYGNCPRVGDTIAYKILELSASFTPELSDYKESNILAFDALQGLVKLKPNPKNQPSNDSERPLNKFELKGLEDEFLIEGQERGMNIQTHHWSELREVRRKAKSFIPLKMTEHTEDKKSTRKRKAAVNTKEEIERKTTPKRAAKTKTEEAKAAAAAASASTSSVPKTKKKKTEKKEEDEIANTVTLPKQKEFLANAKNLKVVIYKSANEEQEEDETKDEESEDKKGIKNGSESLEDSLFTLNAEPHKHSTGSYGWTASHTKAKIKVEIDGKEVELPVTINFNITVHNSSKK
ncbi:hypothetical protein G9A89_006045 [Geosiphon pyriformis]|nr:hypothetical protein G9A89_006045 [Geosiphon pyriformis]